MRWEDIRWRIFLHDSLFYPPRRLRCCWTIAVVERLFNAPIGKTCEEECRGVDPVEWLKA
jgi:hypothetical protein